MSTFTNAIDFSQVTAGNFRDKDRMKTVLEGAGVPCAWHKLAVSAGDALEFTERVGFPLVVKPPAGAGAKSTFRLDDPEDLKAWLDVAAQTADPRSPGDCPERTLREQKQLLQDLRERVWGY